MSKYRETPCVNYIAFGECKKGREACQTGYCQHCDKYCPRARIKHVNKKKLSIEKQKRKKGKFYDCSD